MLCMPFPAILATAFSCACHSCQGIARTRKHSQVLRQHLREQCCNHMDGVMILQAIGDALMDEHNVAQVARPGTSLTRPATGAAAVSQNTLAGAAAHNMQALQSAIACPLHGRAVGSVIAGVHMAFISKCCAQLTTIHHRPAQDMNRCQHDQHVCRLDLPLQRSCRGTLPQHELRLSCTWSQGGASPAMRPMSSAGRPITGFVRPSTSSARPNTGSSGNPRTALTTALKAARPGTGAANRPVTSSGRCACCKDTQQ